MSALMIDVWAPVLTSFHFLPTCTAKQSIEAAVVEEEVDAVED